MTEVADIFRALADGTGAHVAVVHHTGKDLAKGMRGAYALECAFDSVMEIDGEGTSGEGVIEIRSSATMTVRRTWPSLSKTPWFRSRVARPQRELRL